MRPGARNRADGLLYFHEPKVLDIINMDGSNGQFSVNGLRCAVRFAVEELGLTEEYISFFVDNAFHGVHAIRDESGAVTRAEVSVGKPVWFPEMIPFLPPARSVKPGVTHEGYVLDELRCWVLSVGNPHMILFRDAQTTVPPIREIGPYFENHPAFPKRVNVSVAHVRARHLLAVETWERGVGPTACCGSACVAAVVAGVRSERLDDAVDVATEGGDLSIRCSTTTTKYARFKGPPEFDTNVISAIAAGDVSRVDAGR